MDTLKKIGLAAGIVLATAGPLRAKEAFQSSEYDAQLIQGDTYALIINSDENEFRFGTEIEETLAGMRALGVRDEHLYFHSPIGPEEENLRPATLDSLNETISELEERVGQDDQLVIFFSGHGEMIYGLKNHKLDGEAAANYSLEGGFLLDYLIGEQLAGINSGSTITIAPQCYGAGFARALTNERQNSVGLAASELGRASGSNPYSGGFGLGVALAMQGQDLNGKALTIDHNGDGFVTWEEIFQSAAGSYRDIGFNRGYFGDGTLETRDDTPQLYNRGLAGSLIARVENDSEINSFDPELAMALGTKPSIKIGARTRAKSELKEGWKRKSIEKR